MSEANTICATKGRNTTLSWAPTAENKQAILDVIIGRSGTLRAPTLIANNIAIIGFNTDLYTEHLT